MTDLKLEGVEIEILGGKYSLKGGHYAPESPEMQKHLVFEVRPNPFLWRASL